MRTDGEDVDQYMLAIMAVIMVVEAGMVMVMGEKIMKGMVVHA